MPTLAPMSSVEEIRDMMNEGRIAELNALISDDFFSVFSFGDARSRTTYNAQEIRLGNVQAHEFYAGKHPHWHYTNLSWGMRSDTEFVISSKIDFSLNGEVTMNALVMEVYREEDGQWKLLRQYMEKFREGAE